MFKKDLSKYRDMVKWYWDKSEEKPPFSFVVGFLLSQGGLVGWPVCWIGEACGLSHLQAARLFVVTSLVGMVCFAWLVNPWSRR